MKIHEVNDLVITTVLNKKIDEVGYKITYISGLVTAIVFNI